MVWVSARADSGADARSDRDGGADPSSEPANGACARSEADARGEVASGSAGWRATRRCNVLA